MFFDSYVFLVELNILKIIDHYQENNTNNFFNKIYVRLFLLLITIAIITSFSRLGNFLFISLIIILYFKPL